jgi:hypothetical protein
MPRSEIRAADSDRERVLDALRDAAAEGRLDPEEHERRADAALNAGTYGELDALTRDLPRRRRDRPSRATLTRRLVLAGTFSGYFAVMTMLVAIWALTGAGYFWPVWPMLGWGVPLFFGVLGIGTLAPRCRPRSSPRGSLTAR